jgi:hypothetical protein
LKKPKDRSEGGCLNDAWGDYPYAVRTSPTCTVPSFARMASGPRCRDGRRPFGSQKSGTRRAGRVQTARFIKQISQTRELLYSPSCPRDRSSGSRPGARPDRRVREEERIKATIWVTKVRNKESRQSPNCPVHQTNKSVSHSSSASCPRDRSSGSRPGARPDRRVREEERIRG